MSLFWSRLKLSKSILQIPGYWFISLGALLCLSSHLHAAEADRELNLSMAHLSASDEFNQKNLTTAGLGLELTLWPLDQTSFNFSPELRFQNGYQQNLSQTPSDTSQLILKEASFNYFANLNVKKTIVNSIGILPLEKDSAQLLISSRSFPGLRGGFQSELIQMAMSYTIPTNESLSTRSQRSEKTPFLLLASSGFRSFSRSWNISGKLGFFQFQNLPQSLATQSGPKGNSVRAITAREMEFLYSYEGVLSDFNSEIVMSKRQSMLLEIQGLRNSKAEESLSDAWLVSGGYKYRWPSKTSVTLFYEQFSLAPDSAVADYNQSFIGGTNRTGFQTGLKLSVRDSLLLKISGGTVDSLYESPTQFRENFFRFSLETRYADI